MSDWQIALQIVVVVVCFVSYSFGYLHGRSVGHKLGIEEGRRIGAFWQRKQSEPKP